MRTPVAIIDFLAVFFDIIAPFSKKSIDSGDRDALISKSAVFKSFFPLCSF
jgi:hypothetical protein